MSLKKPELFAPEGTKPGTLHPHPELAREGYQAGRGGVYVKRELTPTQRAELGLPLRETPGRASQARPAASRDEIAAQRDIAEVTARLDREAG